MSPLEAPQRLVSSAIAAFPWGTRTVKILESLLESQVG